LGVVATQDRSLGKGDMSKKQEYVERTDVLEEKGALK
jgi:hypothetical protein